MPIMAEPFLPTQALFDREAYVYGDMVVVAFSTDARLVSIAGPGRWRIPAHRRCAIAGASSSMSGQTLTFQVEDATGVRSVLAVVPPVTAGPRM